MSKSKNRIGTIPTYIINLKSREDRLKHILTQFSDKPEFDVSLIEAISHPIGAVGLWQSTVEVVKMAQKMKQSYILICEDDLEFTKDYSYKKLLNNIQSAEQKNADILLGGIHWFNSALKISQDLFWVDIFTATHFMIIYNRFFDTILESDFTDSDISDLKLSELTDNKFVIHPFIAIQREFGYSDVTALYNQPGIIDTAFEGTSNVLGDIEKIFNFFKDLSVEKFDKEDSKNISIPTFIITTPGQPRRLNHIKKQFKNKSEFDINFVEACMDEDLNINRWKSYQEIIKSAINNQYDVIIICEDTHEFPSDYTREYLLENLIAAHQQGVDLISGGAIDCGLIVPQTESRYWVNQMVSTNFIVVYSKLFSVISSTLEEDNMSIFNLESNKAVLYPPVSIERDFLDSRLNTYHNDRKKLIDHMSTRTEKRLKNMHTAYLKFIEHNI